MNDTNELISGYVRFWETRKKKDFNLIGSASDDTVELSRLMSRGVDGKDHKHIDVFYDGGQGVDQLWYTGQVHAGVKVSADSDLLDNSSSYELHFRRGQGDYKGGDIFLSSLDVLTKNVELFRLTDEDDTVDLSQASEGYTFYTERGRDTLIGSNYDDAFFAGSSQDRVFGLPLIHL